MKLKEYLEGHTLLLDGAMGTYLTAKTHLRPDCCELSNLDSPEEVLAIHREYLAAGCNAISTNTFGANRPALGEETCKKVLRAGWELAQKAAVDAFVFADIGPISQTTGEQTAQEYRFVADQFLALGAEHFLFETNACLTGLLETAAHIKEQRRSAFIILSFAALPDGFTRSGFLAKKLIAQAAESPFVDAVGLNCVSGAKHMAALVEELGTVQKPLLAMPNAGYPTVLGSRTFYEGDPEYFGRQLRQLNALGVKLLGGCCGTTPIHMAAAAKALGEGVHKTVPLRAEPGPKKPQLREDPFWTALCDSKQKPFAVELDPPDAADVTKFMAGARELKESGASIITIADCPIARARMDSSLLACKLRRELNMEALPHMTCRDRNLNATKALLLGLCAEGIHNVLVVTGDPIPTASRDEVKSVYNFNSRMLAQYITELGEAVLPTPFRIFGALNLGARNFSKQLELALEKQENGILGFLTQPVLTETALENLKTARKVLSAKILGGIIPIVSHRNALFMNSEIAGITVDQKIIDLYEGLDRAQGEDLAVKVSVSIADAIGPYVDGYYLMTPFGRTGLMGRIMKEISGS